MQNTNKTPAPTKPQTNPTNKLNKQNPIKTISSPIIHVSANRNPNLNTINTKTTEELENFALTLMLDDNLKPSDAISRAGLGYTPGTNNYSRLLKKRSRFKNQRVPPIVSTKKMVKNSFSATPAASDDSATTETNSATPTAVDDSATTETNSPTPPVANVSATSSVPRMKNLFIKLMRTGKHNYQEAMRISGLNYKLGSRNYRTLCQKTRRALKRTQSELAKARKKKESKILEHKYTSVQQYRHEANRAAALAEQAFAESRKLAKKILELQREAEAANKR